MVAIFIKFLRIYKTVVSGSFIVQYKCVIEYKSINMSINMKKRKKLIIAQFREMVRQSRQVIDESIKLVDEIEKWICSSIRLVFKCVSLATLIYGIIAFVWWAI